MLIVIATEVEMQRRDNVVNFSYPFSPDLELAFYPFQIT